MDYWYKHWRNQPPGPFNVPFLGYFPFFFCKKPQELLAQLRNKYGSIVGFYLGEKYVVALNDIASIRENINREEYLGRPKIHPIIMFEKDCKKCTMYWMKTIFTSSGHIWKQEKRLVLRIFHELVFGRKIMEEKVKDEIAHFMMNIEKHDGSSFEMRKYLQVSINNNLSSMIFGHRFDYSDPVATFLTNTVQEFEEANSNADLTSYFPYLKPIVCALGKDHVSQCRSSSKAIADIIKNEINEERKHLDDRNIRSYLHGYLLQMAKDKETTTLTEVALLGTAKVCYIAGTSTTVNTIEWLLLALISNPKIQARVQQEIDKVLAIKGEIDWSDQKNMHYTQAVIKETMRWRTLVPLSVPRCALKETTINGYTIPRNTIIFQNIWAAHNDTAIWEKPEEFNPNRFLDEKGNFVNSESYIPFSVGRRSCPGENLAQLQIFLYSVTILRKYNISMANGDILDLDGISRFTLIPKAFKSVLTPRD